jgi:putative toxin-antitoxin system antitoxin component (TIGR02293 family)
MIEPSRIAEVMGGAAVLRKRVKSVEDLEQAVGDGLPKEVLRIVARRIYSVALDVNKLIYRIVPEATYKRRRSKLRMHESERTERLARIIAAAEEVWENREDAREWLVKPHPELGGRAPITCAMTELGARQVEELLDRLEYGLPV